jgi:hypothetical protein
MDPYYFKMLATMIAAPITCYFCTKAIRLGFLRANKMFADKE